MITKRELEKLYIDEKMSTRKVASKLNCSRSTVGEYLKKYQIPARSNSEANKISHPPKGGIYHDCASDQELVERIVDEIDIEEYKPVKREDQWITLPIKYFKDDNKEKKCTLTLVISDTHFGDCNVLLNSYWSAVDNLLEIMKIIRSKFDIVNFKVVLNGDIVSGRGVYRYQVFRNLLQRGHWQVFLAEKILKETFAKINILSSINDIYMIKGTHEALEEAYILYLKRLFPGAKYLSKHGIINIAESLGKYNVLFTHGRGASYYYPISYQQIREIWKVIAQYLQSKILIERSCVGHTHWLSPNLELEGTVVDISGGFQKWEYTIQQRACGFILYLYYDDEVVAIPIKPNKEVEMKEKMSKSLEYRNLKLYGQILLKHLKEIEDVDSEI